MPFVQLVFKWSLRTIDHHAALNRRSRAYFLHPAGDVFVFGHCQKFGGRTVGGTAHQTSIPGINRHIGNRIGLAADILCLAQTLIGNAEQAL